MDKKLQQSPEQGQAQASSKRISREAEALRANLAKRKQQARARQTPDNKTPDKTITPSKDS